jgi:hypothetical protein
VAADVFISYRRNDGSVAAQAINDHLTRAFGANAVFYDSAVLQPGDKWGEILEERLQSCRVLLAIIGNKWLSDRLSESTDYVKLEIETALKRGVRVIPILVEGAPAPDGEGLPEALRAIPGRQWIKIPVEDPTVGYRAVSSAVERTLRRMDSPRKAEDTDPSSVKLSRQDATTKLGAFLAKSFPNSNSVFELLEITFGEPLLKSLSDNKTNDVNTILLNVIDRGEMTQFLKALMAASPQPIKLEQINCELGSLVELETISTDESVETVKTGLDRVQQLRANEHIGSEINECVRLSQKTLNELAYDLKVLQAYKNLHDILQRIQFEYDSIVDEVRRLRDGGTDRYGARLLKSLIGKVSRFCQDASDAADVLDRIKAGSGLEKSWIRDVTSTLENLEKAIQRLDKDEARSSVLTLRRILGQEPARVNSVIYATAERLTLNNLVQLLSKVASLPWLLPLEEKDIALSKLRLAGLVGELGGLVAVHNRWQGIEKELWELDKEIEATPNPTQDFRLLLKLAEKKISLLWRCNPTAEWVTLMSNVYQDLNALLQNPSENPDTVLDKYQEFRKQALDQFFQVDHSLKSFCSQIVQFSDPVERLLDTNHR